MKKYALAALFFFFSSFFLNAQLTLQQVGGDKKHVIPINTIIYLTFPTKTFGEPEAAFNRYSGRLKNANKISISVVLTNEYRYFIDTNDVKTQLTRAIHPPDSPMITQIPLTHLQSITREYPKRFHASNAGTVFILLAIANNIFIAPHLKSPNDKISRSAGFIAMGLGLSVALIPHEKKYYLEQPKNRNKTLWQLIEN
jgi:hypothetical protein